MSSSVKVLGPSTALYTHPDDFPLLVYMLLSLADLLISLLIQKIFDLVKLSSSQVALK
jgi:hypothetical protein